MADKKEFRGYVPAELNKLIRAVTALKNGDRDWSLSDVLTEALQEWLEKPENQALIEKHNLGEIPKPNKK
ncbi:MAG: hypothetical protein HC895_22700 [Leptolyngbyaceae cyanobacterium SM1_3_5]|nr:hypothetical protein [Leptolyngbyaceae cyanobacterium SM1_3_5]